MLIDLDGRVLAWNTACERLYGWAAEEVLGFVLPHYPEAIRLGVTLALRDIAALGVTQRRTSQAYRKDGSTVGVDVTQVTVSDHAGNPCGVLSIASEVSHDTRFSSMADEFLTAIAHEVTAPLTALQGAAQLLLSPDVAEDSERRAKVARLVADRCRQIGNLVEDLLMSIGFLGGGLHLDDQSIDLAELASEVAARVRANASDANVTVTSTPPVPRLRGDKDRIEQAISIMLSIALEDAGTAPLALSVYDDGSHMVVETVQSPDDGPTAGAENSARVQARGVIGPGARLALVERIAVAHGGSFVSHRPNEAPSSLCLRLPHATGGEDA